jgi:hypothetical protein
VTINALNRPVEAVDGSWLRRLCVRLGGWCGWLVDTHHARIPF